ncbi:MAG: C39 family peptidase [Thermoleophilia bacterium]|nr:C39 family peptidase [Thermoleophilia bacterium]
MAAVALAVLLWPRAQGGPAKRSAVTLKVPGRKAIALTRSEALNVGEGRSSLPMPGRRSITKGSARITYKFDREGARRELVSLAKSGGVVRVDERPVEVLIEAPTVQQAYPNNCETAALQMLLASRGIPRNQTELQEELRRDGVAGGFGVDPKPLIALASRWVQPVDLSGRTPAAIFRRLLSGHAVLAWIGLSAGPYESWIGPRGESVKVNLDEYTVLLRGLAGDRVLVNDPLSGESQLWSRTEFSEKWDLLGRRAISA